MPEGIHLPGHGTLNRENADQELVSSSCGKEINHQPPTHPTDLGYSREITTVVAQLVHHDVLPPKNVTGRDF